MAATRPIVRPRPAHGRDLRRFLEDRPILARRTWPWERAARWCRRNPGLATATTLSALALIASAFLAMAYARQQTEIAQQQTTSLRKEQEQRKNIETSLARVALKEV